MRQWFADSRLVFDDLRRARKGLLHSTDGLAAMPLHHRLWHGHIYWLVKFAKIEIVACFRRIFRYGTRAFCRTADRLCGGNRYRRYWEARQKEIAECHETIGALEAKMRQPEKERFEPRLRDEASTNPGFTRSKPDTIQ